MVLANSQERLSGRRSLVRARVTKPGSPANAHLHVQTDAELVVYLYLTVKDSLHDNSRICQILLS